MVREQWSRAQAAARGPLLVQEGVPHRTQEVAEVVLVAEQAGTGKHPGVGLLHQILSVLARARERPRSPVEPVEVISEPGGVERSLGGGPAGITRPLRG